MIEKGILSDFNLSRKRVLFACKDYELAKNIFENQHKLPLTYKLLTRTTDFYTEHFSELQKLIKREKRLLVFETPSRVRITHEYTIEGGEKLGNGFYFLFNTTERLSWLTIKLEEHRISIASKEKVIENLQKVLDPELNILSSVLNQSKDDLIQRLYENSDGKPCFVEFNRIASCRQQSLLFFLTFFDSIQKKENYYIKRLSPLREKLIIYNYSTLTDNASSWIYFKAPNNFVLSAKSNLNNSRFIEVSPSNDDEITSFVLKPNGVPLSIDIEISINVPKALSFWYNGMFWLALSLVILGVLVFFSVISDSIVEVFRDCSYAMIAALIATRGWLMSEEQVMKDMSIFYTIFIVILIALTITLSLS